MDPNATLELIVEAMDSEYKGGLHEAMTDLWDWLQKGGFAPKSRPMGFIDRFDRHNLRPRNYIRADNLVIQVVNHADRTGRGVWEMVHYNSAGTRDVSYTFEKVI